MPDFIPGLQLSEAYFHEAVRPILDSHFPGLEYSAALTGSGSDVTGFDTPVSRDHEWGPRMQIFLPPDDFEARSAAVSEALRHNLPHTFRGYSTHFSKPDPGDGGVRVAEYIESGPVEHHVYFYTIEQFWQDQLGVSPFADPAPSAWLTFSDQRLLALTAGKVFHDGLGLAAVRARFAYYPHDVWLYLLAAQWSLISQEEAFVGRTAQAGDELGSRVIAARLVERFMRLCFLMEKRYAPYSKWFGTAFRRLECYPRVGPLFEQILAAPDYPTRDTWLSRAYTRLAEMHNALGVTPPLETRTRTYSGWHAWRGGIEDLPLDDPGNTRPFQVIFAGRFTDALLEAVQDPAVRSFLPVAGSVSQFLVESSDALQNVAFCRGQEPLLAER
jgi:hypothetical protein